MVEAEQKSRDDTLAMINHCGVHQTRTLGIPKCPDCFGMLVYLAAQWYCPRCGTAKATHSSGYEPCPYCGY